MPWLYPYKLLLRFSFCVYYVTLIFVCPGRRRRSRLRSGSVSTVCLWGVWPRSPVSAPARWSCAVKGWLSSARHSCRASTSVFLTSSQSCRMGTCVSPGTGRAELEFVCFFQHFNVQAEFRHLTESFARYHERSQRRLDMDAQQGSLVPNLGSGIIIHKKEEAAAKNHVFFSGFYHVCFLLWNTGDFNLFRNHTRKSENQMFVWAAHMEAVWMDIACL